MAVDRPNVSAVRYAEAWNHHIKELAALALAANVKYTDWEDVRDELKNWLDVAIINLYAKD